ncbi:hypothetical protein [Thalassobius sp. MITS945101]|uniref:hypothetical protein n=1 Tax=Thalassobius sp. MITS945101 TaxID=3096994 RepID=UPI00399A8AFE
MKTVEAVVDAFKAPQRIEVSVTFADVVDNVASDPVYFQRDGLGKWQALIFGAPGAACYLVTAPVDQENAGCSVVFDRCGHWAPETIVSNLVEVTGQPGILWSSP